MKPGQSASRRKRILLIYTLVMLIPGIILGFLASRGILNDKALREKQARQELTQISSVFFHNLDSVLNDEVLRPDIRRDGDSYVLLEFEEATGSGFEIINSNLLYYPQSYAVTGDEIDTSIDWEQGWELEFSAKDFPQAITFYQDILERSDRSVDQLEAYMAMARIRMKQHEQLEATKIYQIISDSFPGSTYKGIPARALALKELGTQMAHEELIQELLYPQVPYFKAQYRLLAGDLTGSESSLTELEKKQAQTDQTIQIYDEADLLFKGSVVNPNKRYYSSELYSLAFISNGSLDGTRKGLVVDLIPFIEKHFNQIFDADRQGETHWVIEGESGHTLWGSNSDESTDWLSFSFPDQLPPWKMKLSMVEKSWLSTMLEPGNGVFLLIFIFIILVMGFGLLFTLNILNQEFKLNKLKTEFISNVSHELKSPLTSIRQITEMLNEQRIDSEEQRNDYYGIMLDQSEHLSHLIDNILDFSRMEEDRKHYRFEDIDLVPLLQKLVLSFQHQLDERGFELTFKTDIEKIKVNADRDAIIQVVYNLLDNAVKFSGNGRRIELFLELQGKGQKAMGKNLEQGLREKSQVIVGIQDIGLGISKKDLEKVFDRFYRSSESQKLAIKGSGIGLTLVQRIVDAHHGRIEVDSEQGKGSTFKIFLPIMEDESYEENIVG